MRWVAIKIIGCLTLLTLGLSVTAAQAAEKEKEKVKITGIVRVWGDTDKKISHMEGDLLIVQGELKIRTKYADIDQDKKEAHFTQGVHLEKKDLVIDGDEFTMNFKKKQGTFLGKVTLERAESKDENGKTKDHFKLKCDRLDIDTDKQNFTALGSAVIEHKEFNGNSERVDYDNNAQIMVLKDKVTLIRKSEENLTGNTVRIDLGKKSFEVVDGAELVFDVDKSDENDQKDQSAADEKKDQPATDGSKTPSASPDAQGAPPGDQPKDGQPPAGDSKGK